MRFLRLILKRDREFPHSVADLHWLDKFGCRINTSGTRVRTFSPFPRSPEANLS